MKKLIIAIFIASAGIIACSSTGAKGDVETSEQATAEVKKNHVEVDGHPIYLTKATFLEKIVDYETNPNEWIYKGDKPALVDFYADWCRPCKITSPIMDELAVEYAGKVDIYKVDVDKETELASLFGVRSIPTFLFIPMEGQPSLSSGIAQTPEQTKEMFKQQIEELLLKESNI
jgi:thioredoxin